MKLAEALQAAEDANNEGLLGKYPMACQVLAAAVKRLRQELNEEIREGNRAARDSFAEGQASMRDGYEPGCY